eukprot:3033159-Rhodomonas_salina.7
MSGTIIAYAASARYAMSGTGIAYAVPRMVLPDSTAGAPATSGRAGRYSHYAARCPVTELA